MYAVYDSKRNISLFLLNNLDKNDEQAPFGTFWHQTPKNSSCRVEM